MIGSNKSNHPKGQDAKEFSAKLSSLTQLRAKVRNQIIKKRQVEFRRRSPTVRFTPLQLGDKVWIFYPKKRKGTAKKLVGERYQGPYEVCKQIGETSYQVKSLWGGGKKDC